MNTVATVDDPVIAELPTEKPAPAPNHCIRCRAVLGDELGGCLIYGYNMYPVDALLCRRCHGGISLITGFYLGGGGLLGRSRGQGDAEPTSLVPGL